MSSVKLESGKRELHFEQPKDGAGHFVKMVHNGIEYGDMQMICEAYALMRNVLGMTPSEISTVSTTYNV